MFFLDPSADALELWKSFENLNRVLAKSSGSDWEIHAPRGVPCALATLPRGCGNLDPRPVVPHFPRRPPPCLSGSRDGRGRSARAAFFVAEPVDELLWPRAAYSAVPRFRTFRIHPRESASGELAWRSGQPVRVGSSQPQSQAFQRAEASWCGAVAARVEGPLRVDMVNSDDGASLPQTRLAEDHSPSAAAVAANGFFSLPPRDLIRNRSCCRSRLN